MSDISMAPEQDAIADSLVSEEVAEQPVEQPETEQLVETEAPEQTVEQEQVEPEQEEVENWLPTEQDKIFPDEVLQRYCERYGIDDNLLANPQLKQLVIDKINTDIYLQQQQLEEQETGEPEQSLEPTQTEAPQVSREQYFQNLERVVQERTDPEVAKQFHAEFLRAFGVPDAEIAASSPKQAQVFTQTVSKYALNLMNTYMNDMLAARLQEQVSQAYPGFGDMYERSSHAMAWDQVRNSNQQFATLPAYGTKEFTTTLRDAAARIPGFDEMQFTDGSGRPLSQQANAAKKYTMLAQIASGQNVDPQMLQRAAAAGARNGRRAEVRRSAGNLGSGQSKAASGGNRAPNGMTTNTDLFDEDTLQNYHREHGRL